jgi:MoxR-like ATPase
MQEEVSLVTVPEEINELMDDILCELRDSGLHVSDRKYFGYYPIAKAVAWLYGKSTAEPCDLMFLRHYLWTEPADRETVRSILERLCVNPLKEALANILRLAAESYGDFSAGAESGANATALIGKLRNEFTDIYESLLSLKSKAEKESEKEMIAETLGKIEEYSRKAHADSSFTYAPLSEIFELRKTA